MPQTRLLTAGLAFASSALLAAPIASAAPAWLAPATLDTNPSISTSFAPQVAQGGAGGSLAAWQHNNGGTIEIWHAEHAAGGSWTQSTKLSTGTGVGAPLALRNASGNGLYAWAASGGANVNIRVAQVAPDGAVGAPTSAAVGETDAADIHGAIAPNGDIVLFWSVPVAGPISWRWSRYSAQSGTWSAAATLVVAAATDDKVGLAALPNNEFVATWTASGGAAQASSLAAGAGAWQAPANLDTANAIGGAWVVTHPDGRAVAVWQTALGIRAAERTASSGLWQPAETVRPDPTPILLHQPAIASAGDDTVVVWREDAVGVDDGTIYASRRSGGAWSAAAPISTSPSADDSVDPMVAGLADGRASAIWARSNNVRAATMAAGGTWGGATTISPSTGAITALGGLSLSDDDRGNFVAGWDQFESGGATRRSGVAAYDGAAPAFTELAVPTTAYVNVPYRVKANVTDVWSALKATPTWGFGGAGKAGPQRARAFDVASSYDTFLYSAVGTVDVKLSATDALDQAADVTTKVTVRKPRVAACKKAKTTKNPAKRSKFRVAVNDIRANQRLTQDAIRKLNAVQKWLDEGIRARDICGGALPYWKLDSRLLIGTALPSQPAVRANPRPLKLVRKSKPPARFTTKASQFAKNQRISAAAIRRLNALNKRLNKRLTGGDIVNGQLGRNRLVQGSTILSAAPDPTPPAKSVSKPKKPKSKKVTFKRTTSQVRTNYNIARQALVRANKVYDRARRGLVAANFRNGSVTQEDFTSGALPKPPAG